MRYNLQYNSSYSIIQLKQLLGYYQYDAQNNAESSVLSEKQTNAFMLIVG